MNMRIRSLTLFVLLLLAFTGSGFQNPVQAKYQPMDGQVIKVLNGDTLMFKYKTHTFKLQLYGVDAPESGQQFAVEATRFLKDRVLFKPVHVQILNQDRYKRFIAQVSLNDGQNISQLLISQGMAWWYRDFAPKDQALNAAENQAKKLKKGLWSQANPVPPWEFRLQTQKRK